MKRDRAARRSLVKATLSDRKALSESVAGVRGGVEDGGANLVGVDAAGGRGAGTLVVGDEEVFLAIAVDINDLDVEGGADVGIDGDHLDVRGVGKSRAGGAVEEVELRGEVACG